MKKIFTLSAMIVLAALCCNLVSGQSPVPLIMLNHNGTSAFKTSLNNALSVAQPGDTIYLPGGPISMQNSSFSINIPVTIIGTGHYPDSTSATSATTWYAGVQLYIITGADNGSITGIKGLEICFGDGSGGSATVNHYRIERCYLENLQINYSSGTPQNIYVTENVISRFSGSSYPLFFEKNIFMGNGYPNIGSCSAVFNNNIFYIPDVLNFPAYASFSNNIFILKNAGGGGFMITTGGNTLNNNVFCGECTAPVLNNQSTSLLNNNISGLKTTDVFQNVPYGTCGTSFDYSYDYHLNPLSTQLHNAGTDGTDPGIYGTVNPYKEHGVPFNPHISFKKIDPTLSQTGHLGVDVKVSAQDR